MSKEFMTAIKALRHAGDALRSAGDAMTSAGNSLSSIADLFELRIDKPQLKADMVIDEQEAEDTEEAEEETPSSTHTKAEVKALCVSKSRAGHTDQVKELLAKYGAKNITGLKDDLLEAFYKEAEVIGNAG